MCAPSSRSFGAPDLLPPHTTANSRGLQLSDVWRWVSRGVSWWHRRALAGACEHHVWIALCHISLLLCVVRRWRAGEKKCIDAKIEINYFGLIDAPISHLDYEANSVQ